MGYEMSFLLSIHRADLTHAVLSLHRATLSPPAIDDPRYLGGATTLQGGSGRLDAD